MKKNNRYKAVNDMIVKISSISKWYSYYLNQYHNYDANGQVMATYDITLSTSDNKATLDEQHIYGASRLGMKKPNILLYDNAPISYVPTEITQNTLGETYYEISNYLGNVLNVVTDRKLAVQNGTSATVSYYTADVVSYSDYDPFGMLMPNRHGADGAYRFSFQGQESDPEIKGEGNSVNYSFRMHDPRLGRFFAVDPLTNKYPYWSPYVFSGNQVIHMVELEGLEPATPPIADYIFPDGQEMGREGIEGNLLPLTPPTAGKLTFTFRYPKYAANDLNGYSTWQFDPVKNLWEGESRMVYKETKAGRKSWFASPPDGCVQNGNFLGNCYNVGTSIVGVALFESFIGFPTCPIKLSNSATPTMLVPTL